MHGGLLTDRVYYMARLVYLCVQLVYAALVVVDVILNTECFCAPIVYREGSFYEYTTDHAMPNRREHDINMVVVC